jgi:hypothetical protein
MNIDIIEPGLRVQYVPGSDALDACSEFGHKIGKAVAG